MQQYFNILKELENNLETIQEEPLNVFEWLVQCLDSCQNTLQSFRQSVVKTGFSNENDECTFFKHIKPKVVSYIIFYMNIAKLEKYRPFGSIKMKQKFLRTRIAELQTYFLENQEFYEYHLRGLNDRDQEFFLRKKEPIGLHFDAIPSLVDANFSTTHDMILAKILGNIKTISYLQKELIQPIDSTSLSQTIKNSTYLNWTGTKVDLVELIYALQASTMVNNGNAPIKKLAEGFETLFQIKLGDYYRTFLEIRTRKSKQSKLFHTLKSSLNKKIVEADG